MKKKKVTKYQRKDSPYWWLKWREDGKAKYLNTKTADEDQAETERRKLGDKLTRGVPVEPAMKRVKYDAMADLIRGEYEIKGNKSIKTLVFNLKNLEYFKGHAVSKINRAKVRGYIEQRKEEGAKNSTINRELQALRHMFNLANKEGLINQAMVPDIPRLKENNIKKGFFEYEDFLKFREHLPVWMQRLVTFGYLTGWRVEELKTRTFDHIQENETGPVLILEAGEAKNEEPRKAPLYPELQSILDEIKDEREEHDGYIFLNDKGQKIGDFRKVWNTACVNAGLGYGYKTSEPYAKEMEEKGLKAGPTFHDFRRSTVRELVRSGVPESVAMRLTGHKTRSVFERYNIGTDEDLEQAVEMRQKYLDDRKTVTISVTKSLKAPFNKEKAEDS